jgi:hypothetical protein
MANDVTRLYKMLLAAEGHPESAPSEGWVRHEHSTLIWSKVHWLNQTLIANHAT